MQHSDASYRHLAELLVTALSEKGLIRLRTEKKAVIEKVATAVIDNFRQEQALEKEAERLAEEHLRTAGGGVDRHRVVQLIKQRLAEERRFVL